MNISIDDLKEIRETWGEEVANSLIISENNDICKDIRNKQRKKLLTIIIQKQRKMIITYLKNLKKLEIKLNHWNKNLDKKIIYNETATLKVNISKAEDLIIGIKKGIRDLGSGLFYYLTELEKVADISDLAKIINVKIKNLKKHLSEYEESIDQSKYIYLIYTCKAECKNKKGIINDFSKTPLLAAMHEYLIYEIKNNIELRNKVNISLNKLNSNISEKYYLEIIDIK